MNIKKRKLSSTVLSFSIPRKIPSHTNRFWLTVMFWSSMEYIGSPSIKRLPFTRSQSVKLTLARKTIPSMLRETVSISMRWSMILLRVLLPRSSVSSLVKKSSDSNGPVLEIYSLFLNKKAEAKMLFHSSWSQLIRANKIIPLNPLLERVNRLRMLNRINSLVKN